MMKGRAVPSQIDIRISDPGSAAAQTCLRAYYGDLARVIPGMPDCDTFIASGADQLYPPHGTFLVAHDAHTPIGCVGLRRDGPEVAEVKRLWVAHHARGAQLGRTLMAAVEDAARQINAMHLRLDTSRHLPGAVAFYHRLGWSPIARYNDNPFAHHFFEKHLNQT